MAARVTRTRTAPAADTAPDTPLDTVPATAPATVPVPATAAPAAPHAPAPAAPAQDAAGSDQADAVADATATATATTAAADAVPEPVRAPVVLTPEMMAAAMKIAAEDAGRHAEAQAELDRIAREEETRRQRVLADLAKSRAVEATRGALGTLLATVTAAYLAVSGQDADEATVNTHMDAITDAASELRRAARPNAPRATTGRAGGGSGAKVDRAAPRPLRPEVVAHLTTHPDAVFTPGEVAKVLDRSSGAVSNCLDRLVQSGEAVLVGESPTRYQAAPATRADATAQAADADAA